MAAADLALEERREVVDDKGDGNRGQGGRCCPGKSSRVGEKKKIKFAVDKGKMATGRGENEKNVQEKRKERPYEGREEKERRNEEGKEDIERFLETSWGRFRRDLRSSRGPVAKESYRWRR